VRPARIGCSGWNYADWRGTVYPKGMGPGRWLAHYATLFDTVEVNSTFYRLAKPEAVAKWVEQTPQDFVFTCKASRYLTHIRRLADTDRGVKRFYAGIEPLVEAGRLGPVLWQLPENFRRDDERLAHALAGLPEGRHAFEFRHEGWMADEVLSLLRDHDVALVIQHHPERPWQRFELTADWTFLRFHHGARGRGGNYSHRELDEWAERIAGWRERVEVFAYFNNDWKGFAVENAAYLRRRLEQPAG
jgi:uncharacterized protein YecE (DUF72 family)